MSSSTDFKDMLRRESQTGAFDYAGIAARTLLSIWIAALGAAYVTSLGPAMLAVCALLAAAIFIARQQRVMELLVHDASHGNFVRSNAVTNDLVATILAAAPMAQTVRGYRHAHMWHHSSFGSDRDPDLERHQSMFGADIFSGSLLHRAVIVMRRLPRYMVEYYISAGSDLPALGSFCVWHIVFGIVPAALLLGSLSAGAAFWAAFWLLPMLVVLPILRFVAEAEEHRYADGAGELESSCTNLGRLHELLIHPWNDGYHLLHHMYPNIPQACHPRVHRLLIEHAAEYRRSSIRRSVLGEELQPRSETRGELAWISK